MIDTLTGQQKKTTLVGFFRLERKFPHASPRGAAIIRCMAFVIFFAVITNVPFWVATRVIGLLPSGRFCVEYLGIGIVALFLPRRLSAMLLLLATSADILAAVSRTYQVSPVDCIESIRFISAFNTLRLLGFVAIGVLALLNTTIAAAFLVERITVRQRLITALCLATAVLAGLGTDYLDIAILIGRFPDPFVQLPATDAITAELKRRPILRRPFIQLFQQERALEVVKHAEWAGQYGGGQVVSASHLALQALASFAVHDAPAPNIVVVLVESWGLANDSGLGSLITAPYFRHSVTGQYKIVQGDVAFHGSTIAGESRELCGKDLGFGILDGSLHLFQDCLPLQLKALGYHTIAAHGNSGYFFRRNDWYRRAGFDERWFGSDFRSRGLPDCIGTVLGTCDANISQWIGTKLADDRSEPEFVYWVTLNSHLPVPIPAPASTNPGLTCASLGRLSESASLCSWYRLVATAQDSIATLAAAQSSPRPTVFVVVGDHAPPFANPMLRGLFSGTKVPYVVLIPRSIATTRRSEASTVDLKP